MKFLLPLFVLVFMVSCATSSRLTKAGVKVKVIQRAGKSCSVVGKVVGVSNTGIFDIAKNIARNKAAELEATAIIFKEEFSNGKKVTVHGIAYVCP